MTTSWDGIDKIWFDPPEAKGYVEVAKPCFLGNGMLHASVSFTFPFDPKQVGEAVEVALNEWKKSAARRTR